VNVLNSDLAAANLSDPVSGFAGIPRPMTTFVEKLRDDAGYATAMAGKASSHSPTQLAHLSLPLKPLGPTCPATPQWHAGLATFDHLPSGRGYNKSLVYLDGANTQFSDACTGWCSESGLTTDIWQDRGPAFRYNNSLNCSNTNQGPDCPYEDAVFSEFLIDVVQAHDTSQPLFLYFAPHSVHVSADGLILEVPTAQEEKFMYINNTFRRRYAAITNLIDSLIGNVVDAIKAKGMWDDCLVVMSADNGGLTVGNGFGGANNFPRRGGKQTNFQGGVNVNAFVSGGASPSPTPGPPAFLPAAQPRIFLPLQPSWAASTVSPRIATRPGRGGLYRGLRLVSDCPRARWCRPDRHARCSVRAPSS
jgi:arylsulfatase B